MEKIYSHSRLSTFEQCPLKFKFRYIDKIIPEIEKTIESHLGDIVHSTLEWIYQKTKENIAPILDDIIIYYSEKWKKEYSPEIKIINQNLSAKDYFNKGIEFLVDYFKKHYPFEDGTIDIEKKVNIKLGEKGEYEIIGFIDRLVFNLQTGEYEIHDYKTTNSMPSQEKIDNDRQLALYALAIKDMYGKDKEVCLVWHYLAHNKKIISKRTNNQLEQLKKETIELIKKIESTNEFLPKTGILCKWCAYKKMCSALNNSQDISKNKEIQIDKKRYPTASKYIKD